MGKTILAIGDTHFPFANKQSLNRIYEITKQVKPQIIVQIGDLYDMFSFGRFPRSLSVIAPKDEVSRGREEAEVMWRWLSRLSPKAKLFQLMGNHDERPLKKILTTFPEAESLLRVKELFEFHDVETLKAERDELIIDKILFMHGFRSKLGDHARHNHMSTVCGHSHQGGSVFMRLGDKTIFELNCGYIADPHCEALSYTRQRRISNWTQGVGLIDANGPRFIPFENP